MNSKNFAIFFQLGNRVSEYLFLRSYSAKHISGLLVPRSILLPFSAHIRLTTTWPRGEIYEENQHQQTASGSLYAAGGHHIRRFQYGIRILSALPAGV
uniref:Uncharacterized protein n=1 Tax=Escherichia coli TaxID=562 RepID=A0A8F1IF92_ECOLX|nr:hypothetical protein IHCLGBEB_00012 [Escherichia coli]